MSGRGEFDAIFYPESVAVIGASPGFKRLESPYSTHQSEPPRPWWVW
ncbi:hypothetical protein ACFLYR_04020 [Chloroflexota bacterium]